MTPLFLQEATPTPTPPSSGGGGITINFPQVDWTQLIPQLVGLFFDAVGTFVMGIVRGVFDGVWSSSANVIGQTDLGMTWGFGPIHDQVVSVQGAARAVLLFALILLGLKSMLGGLVRSHSDVIGDFVNGVLMSVILVAAFPLVIPEVIGLTNAAAAAVGRADLERYVSPGVTSNVVLQAVLFIILLFFAARLLLKAIWRIGFLAVLLPFGVAACALYGIPQTRWLLGWWVRVWGGMLVAQIPSVLALTIGAQLFARGSGTVGSFFYSIAFMQLATDLYSLIPFGGTGGGGGAPWSGVPWRALPFAGGGVAGAAAGAAAGTLARTEARYPWPAGVTTESMANQYGYQ